MSVSDAFKLRATSKNKVLEFVFTKPSNVFKFIKYERCYCCCCCFFLYSTMFGIFDSSQVESYARASRITILYSSHSMCHTKPTNDLFGHVQIVRRWTLTKWQISLFSPFTCRFLSSCSPSPLQLACRSQTNKFFSVSTWNVLDIVLFSIAFYVLVFC